jgi:hypothetical protein
MLRTSPILILDEPTVGLDRDSEFEVIDAIWHLAEGRTTLFVTHDLALAAQADRILLFWNGRIIEDGTHADLIVRGGRYAALWHTRASTSTRSPIMLSLIDREVVERDPALPGLALLLDSGALAARLETPLDMVYLRYKASVSCTRGIAGSATHTCISIRRPCVSRGPIWPSESAEGVAWRCHLL